MSRLIVKGMAPSLTDQKFKRHFQTSVSACSFAASVTDAKIVRTKDGRSRCFGFIGFREAGIAKKIIKMMNKSFIGSMKITVEQAKPVGSRDITRPWSKHSVGSSRYQQRQKTKVKNKKKTDKKRKKKNKYGTADEDAPNSLKDFLSCAVSQQLRSWENDFNTPAATTSPNTASTANAKKDKTKISKKKKRKTAKKEADSDSEDESSTTEDSSSESSEEASAEDGAGESSAHAEEPKRKQGNTDPKRLFLRNLSYDCTQADIESFFSKHQCEGVVQVHLPMADESRGRCKGFAYVTFESRALASAALKSTDKKCFLGRLIHILPARARVQSDATGGDEVDETNYKKKKAAQLRKTAADERVWSSLFISSNTVANLIAQQLSVKKSDLFDPSGQSKASMAVKLALGETHIIQQTKQMLEDEGVNLALLEQAARRTKGLKRSTRVLILKNLPVTSDAEELRHLLAQCGEIGRFILPPLLRTLCVCEFLAESGARKAFRSLAYTRYHDTPLYLEWAPEGILQDAPDAPEAKTSADAVPARQPSPVATADVDDESEEGAPQTTLFVKNLNFSTDTDALRAHFQSEVGGVRSALVSMKSKTLSNGFGFVEFASARDAKRAQQQLQGSTLDGHELKLELAKRAPKRKKTQTKTKKKKKKKKTKTTDEEEEDEPTKLLVRNIAFEATRQELRELFGSFGQTKSIRLPKRLGFAGGHRGFAFVEFVSASEARAAFQALETTHFYGRRLVIEWSKDRVDED